jgi:hypothetical protein
VLGFSGIRALEQRLQLKEATALSRISKAQFDELQVRGLWPPHQEASPVETWSDLLTMRRRIRKVWSTVCRGQVEV